MERAANPQVISPIMYSPPPTSNVFHKPRENPFNKDEETSYCDLWVCMDKWYVEALRVKVSASNKGTAWWDKEVDGAVRREEARYC